MPSNIFINVPRSVFNLKLSKSLTYLFKLITNLKWLLSSVYKLVPFKLGALNERLATFSADVHARSVGVQMLAHCSIVSKQLAATLRYQHLKTTTLCPWKSVRNLYNILL